MIGLKQPTAPKLIKYRNQNMMRLLRLIGLLWTGLQQLQRITGLRSYIAIAWLLQKEPVIAPIIGATKMSHLEDAVRALSVKLTSEEMAFLEEPYVPHPIVGHH